MAGMQSLARWCPGLLHTGTPPAGPTVGYTVPLPLSTSCNSHMVTFFLMLSIISKYVIHMES